MTVYKTDVVWVGPSPLGLVGSRWVVEHWCTTCRQPVPGDQLVAHAQDHHDDDRLTAADA